MAAHQHRRQQQQCGGQRGQRGQQRNARGAMELNTGLILHEAVKAGLGIGELATHIAAGTHELVRIWPEREQSYEVYLVVHSGLNRSARVRAAADAIIESFPRQ